MYNLKDKLYRLFKPNLVSTLMDVLLYYTFGAILFKSIVFLSFTVSENLSVSNFEKVYKSIWSLPIYCSFIAILLSFAFLFKGRLRLWFLILLNLAVSVLLVFDMWYYRGFGDFISLHLLKQSANLDSMSNSIFSMGRSADLIFIFDIPILFVIALACRNIYKKMTRSVILFALLIIASSGYIAYMHHKVDTVEQGQKQILFRICWTPNQTIFDLSPVGYHLYDIYCYWQDNQQLVLKPEEKQQINSWFEAKKENLPDNQYKSMFKGKNLIFIQVESLENFVINQKINGQEITPNLNKLLKNSLYFSNFYEQVYNGTSSDADLMANTSVYPVRRGSTFFRYPYNTYNSMPLLLQKQGYSTLAIHPDKGAFWNWMEALTSFGFQKCLDASYFVQDEKIGLGLSDASFFRQLEPIVVKEKQPFYTFMVTLTSHSPFDLPEKYRELKIDEKLDKTKLGGYFQSINYADKQIGSFISKLDTDMSLDNTVIVIYGDHCGIHKYYTDEVNAIQPSESWWLNNNTQIPFIIYQNHLQGQEIKITGGQIDILPTVSYLMGIDQNAIADTAMGRNLLNTKKDFAVLASKDFKGVSSSEKDKQDEIDGIDIADKIIRSNYFKQ